MINITDKRKCCGCTACQQVCPKQCISMQCDEQGFNYPLVDELTCIGCNLCEKVCPVINQYDTKDEPLVCYLFKTEDEEVRSKSSSGGIFTCLAKYVISQGGVVFGVKFDDNWQAIYDFTDSLYGLAPFRGSKYIQADVNGTFNKVEEFLKTGRLVLFSGTPCYVSALNHYLRKQYDNLLTIDIVCHSIPSPKIWSRYLSEFETKLDSKIIDVTFRDKSNGWSNYSIGIQYMDKYGETHRFVESHFDNLFLKAFGLDLFTRPSCSDCPARNYKSHSDITIADAWAVNKYHPELNDEKGLSHLIVNSNRGKALLKSIFDGNYYREVAYNEIEPLGVHAPITRSTQPSRYRDFFYSHLDMIDLENLIKKCIDKHEKYEKMTKVLKNVMSFFGIYRIYNIIKNK